jgi:hypothetical protein
MLVDPTTLSFLDLTTTEVDELYDVAVRVHEGLALNNVRSELVDAWVRVLPSHIRQSHAFFTSEFVARALRAVADHHRKAKAARVACTNSMCVDGRIEVDYCGQCQAPITRPCESCVVDRLDERGRTLLRSFVAYGMQGEEMRAALTNRRFVIYNASKRQWSLTALGDMVARAVGCGNTVKGGGE